MRGGPEAGARSRRQRGRLERGCDRLVRPRCAGGELPRALRVVVRQGAGDRPVGVAAGDGGGSVVGGGAQQRVAERDLAGRERDDPGALGALERRHVDARRRPSAPSTTSPRRASAAATTSSARRVSSSSPSSRRASTRSSVEPGGSGPSTGARPSSSSRLSSAGISSSASGLPAAVSSTRRATRSGTGWVRPAWRSSSARSGARGPSSTVSMPGATSRSGRWAATMRDPVRAEPPGGEAQRLERRLVEPLEVVDHAQHRALLRGEREQPEQRGADRQARLRRRGLELERSVERRRLGGGQPVAQPEHRLAQLGQPGERQLRLALQPARAQHGHAVGALDRRAQQRRLADPGLAAQHEHVAAAPRAVSSARSTRPSSASRPISTNGRVSQDAARSSWGIRTRVPRGPVRVMCRA